MTHPMGSSRAIRPQMMRGIVGEIGELGHEMIWWQRSCER